MRLLPKDKAGRIEFCEIRLEPWAERAEAIGTTPEQVAELAMLTEQARQAHAAQSVAYNAARAATLRLDQAIAKMSNTAQGIILQIRSKASRDGDNVYAQASIPVPEKASPIAMPGRPTRFNAQLQQTGQIKLTWQCKNPRNSQGTIYQVWRSVDGGEPKFLGGSGKKAFVDNTIPPGTAKVTYRIRAERSTRVGQWAEFPVNLGTPAGLPILFHTHVATQRNAA
jgi:hypothetical protein